jgi:hypothetical protein
MPTVSFRRKNTSSPMRPGYKYMSPPTGTGRTHVARGRYASREQVTGGGHGDIGPSTSRARRNSHTGGENGLRTGQKRANNGPRDVGENDQGSPSRRHGENGPQRATDGPKRAPVPQARGDPPMGPPRQEFKVRSIREETRLSCANSAKTSVSEQKRV